MPTHLWTVRDMIINTCCKKNFIYNQVLFSSDAHIVSIVDIKFSLFQNIQENLEL